MFPACAGMNRDDGCGWGAPNYVPRMRGDEPETLVSIGFGTGCSPHARG